MPAIRLRLNASCTVVDHRPSGLFVDILQKNGGYARLAWLGLICKTGIQHVGGIGFGKMRAQEVVRDADVPYPDWMPLKAGQHVVCWRVPHAKGGSHQQGVYGVVGDDGWPLLV